MNHNIETLPAFITAASAGHRATQVKEIATTLHIMRVCNQIPNMYVSVDQSKGLIISTPKSISLSQRILIQDFILATITDYHSWTISFVTMPHHSMKNEENIVTMSLGTTALDQYLQKIALLFPRYVQHLQWSVRDQAIKVRGELNNIKGLQLELLIVDFLKHDLYPLPVKVLA